MFSVKNGRISNLRTLLGASPCLRGLCLGCPVSGSRHAIGWRAMTQKHTRDWLTDTHAAIITADWPKYRIFNHSSRVLLMFTTVDTIFISAHSSSSDFLISHTWSITCKPVSFMPTGVKAAHILQTSYCLHMACSLCFLSNTEAQTSLHLKHIEHVSHISYLV